MKKKFSQPACRLPIDFGDEPVFLIPVHKWAGSLRRFNASTLQRFNESGSSLSKGRGRSRRSAAKAGKGGLKPSTFNLKPRYRAFTLVEILVVLALLSLIVFALMAVFAGTQRAFRASLTQTDTLEGGRAVMDLIAGDLEAMAPSDGPNFTGVNGSGNFVTTNSPVNFSAAVTSFPLYPPSPLYQPLIGSPTSAQRINIIENIFILSKGNINGVSSWIATGYSVRTNLSDGALYPLYRFYMTTNAASGYMGQFVLYTNFIGFQFTNSGVWSHLMDGVVNLTARPYDTNGVWMTNGYYANASGAPFIPVQNSATFIGSGLGETSCFFVSNAVPASVSFVLGTVEDRVLKHAEGLSGPNQSNYLANAAGQVHIFTRRVWIRNYDPTAYQ